MPRAKKKKPFAPIFPSSAAAAKEPTAKKESEFSHLLQNQVPFPQLWMDFQLNAVAINPYFFEHYNIKSRATPFPFEQLKHLLPADVYENIIAVNQEFSKPLPLCYLEEEDYFILATRRGDFIETLISSDKEFQPFRSPDYNYQNSETGNNILSKRSEGTALRLRLRQFSQIIETLEPETIRNILSKYCRHLLPTFKNYQGSEFQIAGSGFLEIFDSSQGRPDHALAALESGFIQIELAKAVVQIYAKQKIPLKNLCAGIDSGDLVIGNLDTSSRNHFTIIGKPAQIAEDLTHFAEECEIVISENGLNSILKNLPNNFTIHWEGVDPLDVNATKMLTLKKQGEEYIYFKFLQVIQPRSHRHPIPVFQARLCKNDLLPRRKHSQLSPEDEKTSHLIFGKYRLIQKLGKGGMGEVWKALDPFGNTLAIKTMLGSNNATEEEINRFRREADIMSRLNHHSICRVFEIGKAEGHNYIAMQYVEGVPLSRILDRRISEAAAPLDDLKVLVDQILSQQITGNRPIPPPEEKRIFLEEKLSVNIILEICEIIKFAHEHNVYHRDVKPQNIMINRETHPILMDFGVAKLDSSLSNPHNAEQGQIFGTIEYMAPEQANGNVIDNQKVDIYAIGAVLYQILTGEKHYVSTKNIVEDVKILQTHEASRLKFNNGKTSGDLQAIVLKCLRNNPAERYDTVEELMADLLSYQNNQPVLAKKPSVGYYLIKMIARHKAHFFLICMVFALAATGIYQEYKAKMEKEGHWVLSEKISLTEVNKLEPFFEFKNSLNRTPIPPYPLISTGMLLKPYSWCWLKTEKAKEVNRETKIKIEFTYYGNPDLFKIQMNSDMQGLPNIEASPTGFGLLMGEYGGSLDILAKTWPEKTHPNMLVSAPVRIKKGTAMTVEIIKENGYYIYTRNGEELLKLECPGSSHHPLPQHFGFFTKAENLVIHSLEIYRKALPKNSSAMLLADGFLKSQNYFRAVEELINLSKDLNQQEAAEAAIFKAYQILFENGDQKGFTKQNLLTWMKQRAPHSRYLGKIYDLKSEKAFAEKKYAPATQFLDSAFRLYPESGVLSRIDINSLPPEVFNRVFHYAKKNPDFNGLSISGKAGLNFQALTQWEIHKLQWRENQIQNINPLKNMPLSWLDISGNFVMEISPLKGKFIQYLNIAKNKIHDLSPISGMLIENLNLESNGIVNISSLSDMPLNQLNIANNKIGDLSALEKCPLYELNASGNVIFDVKPLNQPNLRILNLEHNLVESLSPLQAMPLIHLNLRGNPIHEIPRLNASNLKYLNISDTPVENISNLGKIDLYEFQISNTPLTSLKTINTMNIFKLNISNQNLNRKFQLVSPLLKDLKADSCRIQSLSGIRKLKLNRLSLSHNQISDFKDLTNMRLSYLNIEGNLHHSLKAFHENPPDTLLFYNENISPMEISKAVKHWGQNSNSNFNLYYATTALILKTRDIKKAKAFNQPFKGSRYIHFPQKLSKEEARILAASLGGKLAQITSQEENDYVLSILRDNGGQWIDIENKNGEWVFQNDSLLEYVNSPNGISPQSNILLGFGDIYNGGKWVPLSPTAKTGFIVEWEDGLRSF